MPVRQLRPGVGGLVNQHYLRTRRTAGRSTALPSTSTPEASVHGQRGLREIEVERLADVPRNTPLMQTVPQQ